MEVDKQIFHIETLLPQEVKGREFRDGVRDGEFEQPTHDTNKFEKLIDNPSETPIIETKESNNIADQWVEEFLDSNTDQKSNQKVKENIKWILSQHKFYSPFYGDVTDIDVKLYQEYFLYGADNTFLEAVENNRMNMVKFFLTLPELNFNLVQEGMVLSIIKKHTVLTNILRTFITDNMKHEYRGPENFSSDQRKYLIKLLKTKEINRFVFMYSYSNELYKKCYGRHIWENRSYEHNHFHDLLIRNGHTGLIDFISKQLDDKNDMERKRFLASSLFYAFRYQKQDMIDFLTKEDICPMTMILMALENEDEKTFINITKYVKKEQEYIDVLNYYLDEYHGEFEVVKILLDNVVFETKLLKEKVAGLNQVLKTFARDQKHKNTKMSDSDYISAVKTVKKTINYIQDIITKQEKEQEELRQKQIQKERMREMEKQKEKEKRGRISKL